MNIIDLTHDIYTGMMKYPGDPDISLNEALVHETDYCHVDRLHCGSHTGTHIDAPFHFLPDGKRITDFPIAKFFGEGVVADLRHKKAGEPITIEDLQLCQNRLRSGDFLLLQTGWCQFFGTEKYLDHPYISAEAARWIVEQNVSIVAVDFLNVDSTLLEVWDAHPELLSHDVLIVENIAHSLQLDADKRYQFSFAPLKLQGSDGAPIRAYAVETE